MTVYLFASLTPIPEHVADVEAELTRMVAATRTEPGNRRYDLLSPVDGTRSFHLYEIYVDEAALQAHRDSAHYKAFRAKIGAWLVGPPDVKVMTGVDVAA